MRTAIFHSVNAGLYLYAGGTGLLVDGIHAGRKEGFSPMPPRLVRQMQDHTGLFSHTDGLLFTHLHGDHFDAALLRTALDTPAPPVVYGPRMAGNSAPVRTIRPGLKRIRIGGAYILTMATVHDGEAFREDPHESLLIRMGGESFFIAGDAVLCPEQAEVCAGVYGAAVDAAFLNLYQLASAGGQAFLRVLAPRRVFLYHLPFPGEDPYHYHSLARQVLRRRDEEQVKVELLDQMAWLDGAPAPWAGHTGGGRGDERVGIVRRSPPGRLGA